MTTTTQSNMITSTMYDKGILAGAAESPPSDPKGQLVFARLVDAPALPHGHYCIFDIEIATPIPPTSDGKLDWDTAKRGECGVGCVVVWDSFTQRYHLYDMHNIEACMAHLNSVEYIVSYNGDNFDIPCLQAVTKINIQTKSYDILQLIWKNLGVDDFHKGYSLASVAWRTCGLEKSGNGADAPLLIQQGRWAECLDYCLNDVHLTKAIWNEILSTRSVIDINGDYLGVI